MFISSWKPHFNSFGEVFTATWSLLDLPDSSFMSVVRSFLSSQTVLPLHLLIFLLLGVDWVLVLGEAVLDDQMCLFRAPHGTVQIRSAF